MTEAVNALPLRQRKQARIRRTIQDEAFRLFEAKGYDATTVEEIAVTADISPRTFFRYFPSKEGVVFWPSRAPDLAGHVAKRPAGEPAVRAVMRAMTIGLKESYSEDRDRVLRSLHLAFGTPSLKPRLFAQQVGVAEVVAGILAKRQRRDPRSLEVRSLAASIGAALFVALDEWQASGGRQDLGNLITRAVGNVVVNIRPRR